MHDMIKEAKKGNMTIIYHDKILCRVKCRCEECRTVRWIRVSIFKKSKYDRCYCNKIRKDIESRSKTGKNNYYFGFRDNDVWKLGLSAKWDLNDGTI